MRVADQGGVFSLPVMVGKSKAIGDFDAEDEIFRYRFSIHLNN